MADNLIKISELHPTTQLKSADRIPIEQDGQTRSIKGAVLEQNLLNKTDARYIENSKKGAPNGVATLDSNGKLPNSQLSFGKVVDGDTNVVSGGEVWESIKDYSSGIKPINLSSEKPSQDGIFQPIEVGVYPNYGGLELTQEEKDSAIVYFYLLNGVFSKEVKEANTVDTIEPNSTNAVSSQAIYDYSIRNVSTIEDLREIQGFDGQKINLLGYYKAGDKAPLLYEWVYDIATDDGGSIIVPNKGGGYWEAQFVDNNIDFRDFGIVGGIEIDEVNRLTKLFNYIKGKVSVTLKGYNLNIYTTNLICSEVFHLEIKSDSTLNILPTVGGSGIFSPIQFNNIEYFYIEGVNFDGRYDYMKTLPQRNWNNGNLVFRNCININIRKCKFKDSGYNTSTHDKFGDAIYVTKSANFDRNTRSVIIEDNFFENSGRWDVAVLSGEFISIKRNISTFKDDAPSLGFVDIEYWAHSGKGYKIDVSDNYVIGSAIINVNGDNGFENVVIENNYLDNKRTGGKINETLYSYGISVEKTQKVSIRNNTLLNVSRRDALTFINGVYSGIVDNNTLETTATAISAIYANNITNVSFTNNKLKCLNASNGEAFKVINADRCNISNNFVDCGNVGYELGLKNSNLSNNDVVNSKISYRISSVGNEMNNIIQQNRGNIAGRIYNKGLNVIENNFVDFNKIAGDWEFNGSIISNQNKSNYNSTFNLGSIPISGSWRKGAEINVITNTTADKYICTVSGTFKTTSTQGTNTTSSKIISVSDVSIFNVGDFIRYRSNSYEIINIDNNDLIVNLNITSSGSGDVTFIQPTFINLK